MLCRVGIGVACVIHALKRKTMGYGIVDATGIVIWFYFTFQ